MAQARISKRPHRSLIKSVRAGESILKLARGGALGQREAQLIVTEKGVALAEAIGTLATGGSAEKVLRRYRKLMRANKRRLSRR